MKLNLNQKLSLMILVFFLVPLTMFAATLYIISQQRNDGLVINLAGRQRMLSQKMSKESLSYLHSIIKKLPNADQEKKQLINTMEVFEITLNSLRNSGEAPLSTNLKGEFRQLPAAEGIALAQLAKVNSLWVEYKEAIIRSIDTQKEEDIQAVLKTSLLVLKEMNAGVVILQQQAEKRSIGSITLKLRYLFLEL